MENWIYFSINLFLLGPFGWLGKVCFCNYNFLIANINYSGSRDNGWNDYPWLTKIVYYINELSVKKFFDFRHSFPFLKWYSIKNTKWFMAFDSATVKKIIKISMNWMMFFFLIVSIWSTVPKLPTLFDFKEQKRHS